MSHSSSRTVTPVAEVMAAADGVEGDGGEGDTEQQQLETMMAEKAAEIFNLCDRDGKGLLSKSDMRLLASELPLTAEQLEDVFDSLDVAGNGFLTSVEFANGFGKFLGLSVPPSPTFDSSELKTVVYEAEPNRRNSLDVTTDEESDDEAFDEFMSNLGANSQFDDVDAIKSMWQRLRRDENQPELLENFEDLLRRLTAELSRSHLDYHALKMNCRKNNNAYNEEIGNLYEEMESKINAEKQRLRLQEKIREKRLKEEMERELEEKDRRVNELLAREKELERTLIELNAKELKIQLENLKLQKEKDEIEERLTTLTANRIEETVKLHGQNRMENEIRSMAAVQIAQWLEMERENLVRQLQFLRVANQRQIDIQDERSLQNLSLNDDDGSQFPRRSSIQQPSKSQISDDSASENYDSVDANSESQFSGLSSEEPSSKDDADDSERQQPIGANSAADDNVDKSLSKSTSGSSQKARLYKIVFIGDSGVGKSSFIHRFCSQTFRPSFSATIGVDFQVKNVEVDGHPVALQLWDTAGQERFRTFTKQYFRKADGILVMYDVTDLQTFKSVREWMDSIQDAAEEGTVLVLLGNKVDLVEDNTVKRAVLDEDGKNLADEYNAIFFETSAKSGLNIQLSIETMARKLQEREDSELEKTMQSVTLLDDQHTPKNSKGLKKYCCS